MKKSVQNNFLKETILYQHIFPEWETVINAGSEKILFKKGASIFKEGNPVKGIFFLSWGKVKIHQYWGSGKELIIGFAKGGDMVGYRGLGKDKLYHASATALENTETCFISTPLLERTLQMNPGLTNALLNFFAQELQDTETRMRNMALMEVKGRVCETLLMLKAKFGTTADGFINIILTRQDLAAYTGTTYETFFRTMQELEREKLVKVRGKEIGIVNEKKLAQSATPRKSNR